MTLESFLVAGKLDAGSVVVGTHGAVSHKQLRRTAHKGEQSPLDYFKDQRDNEKEVTAKMLCSEAQRLKSDLQAVKFESAPDDLQMVNYNGLDAAMYDSCSSEHKTLGTMKTEQSKYYSSLPRMW